MRQGGILSPKLFIVYMDDLSDQLNNSNIGGKFGSGQVTISSTISLTMPTSTMEINEIVDDGPATRNDGVNDAYVK